MTGAPRSGEADSRAPLCTSCTALQEIQNSSEGSRLSVHCASGSAAVCGGLHREAPPLTVALLLPGVGLLVGVLLLVPCLRLGCALLVPRRLLAVLRVSCGGKETHSAFLGAEAFLPPLTTRSPWKSPGPAQLLQDLLFTMIRMWRYSRSDTVNTI